MKVIVANSQKEITDHFYVRGMVFVVEQQIDYQIEFDGLDSECVLFVCYQNDVAVGAARLYKNKVGRLATLSTYRKQGVATALMEYIEGYANNNKISELTLHAQIQVKDFYKKRGYNPSGEIFQEANIDHIKMDKKI